MPRAKKSKKDAVSDKTQESYESQIFKTTTEPGAVYMVSEYEMPTHEQLCCSDYMLRFRVFPAAAKQSMFLFNCLDGSEDIGYRRAFGPGDAQPIEPWFEHCALIILSSQLSLRSAVVAHFVGLMNKVFYNPITLERLDVMVHEMFYDAERFDKLIKFSHDLADTIGVPIPSPVYIPQMLYLADFLAFDTQYNAVDPPAGSTKKLDANIMAHIMTIWNYMYCDKVPKVDDYRKFIDTCIAHPDVGYKVIHTPLPVKDAMFPATPPDLDPEKFPNVKYNMGVYYRCVFGIVRKPQTLTANSMDTDVATETKQIMVDDDAAIEALKPIIDQFLSFKP